MAYPTEYCTDRPRFASRAVIQSSSSWEAPAPSARISSFLRCARGDLRDRRGQDGDVVGGGVRAGVPGAQHQRERLLGVLAPHPERVVAEPLLERDRGPFLLRVRRHQGRVDIEDDGVTEVGVGDLRGRHPAGQLGPHVRADLGPGLVDPLHHGGGDLVQGPPHRRRRRDRPEDLALVAQHVDVRDRLPAAGDQHRHIDQHPAPVVHRGEPAPGHRPGQGARQADLVGQQPGRHVPRVGHDTRPIGGERQPVDHDVCFTCEVPSESSI